VSALLSVADKCAQMWQHLLLLLLDIDIDFYIDFPHVNFAF